MSGNLSYCGEQVRKGDPDRFLTCLFAPAERREDLFALYALNLELARTREIVREPIMGRIRLQWWREAMAEIYQGSPPRAHPVLQALAPVLPRRVDQKLVQALIEAREMDLTGEPPETGAAVIDYTRGSGGSLMRMAALMLGTDDRDLAERAELTGEGVALAGLLRSVPYHAAQGRSYLPSDLLRHMGVDPSYSTGRKQMGTEVVIMLMAKEAERLMDFCPRRIDRHYIAAFLPVVLGRAWLHRLVRAGHDPFDRRNAAPYPFKAASLASAWATGCV